MAGQEEKKDDALAEKAYEAAAAKTPITPPKSPSPQPLPASKDASPKDESVKPAEAKSASTPAPVPASVSSKPLPGLPQPVAAKSAPAKPVAKTPPAKAAPVQAPAAKAPEVKAPVAAAPKPASVVKAKKIPAKPVKAAAVKPPVAKAPAAETPVAAKPAIAVAKDKPASAPVPPAAATKAAKTAESKTNTFAGLFTPFILEEKTMDISANFAGFQDAVTEAQAKAKAAFEKSSVAFGEAGDFAKGNVEAVIESGKIFAEGIQGFGSEFVAEGRTAFETFTGDIKELAAAKSPTDFFKLQGDILRKNFDSAVAYGSKNSEAALKLFSDTIAPISGRVSVAVEKARQVAV
jgi:hypothetical protein